MTARAPAPFAIPDIVTDHGDGIHSIDTGFHRPAFDAAWLVVDGDRAVIVDTGTAHALPRVLAALDSLGVSPDRVDHLILTHVHLDHAGGAGQLMQALPNARLLVHPRGARHMADPTALYHGALQVYGQDEMDRAYGQLLPIDAARIDESHDGMVLPWRGRGLTLIDTPGHARHHHAIWDPRSRSWFTGDTFGLSYREFDDAEGRPFAIPTTTPVQFEPDELVRSIDRMLAFGPQWMNLTHYARVGDVPRLAASVQTQVRQIAALGRGVATQPGSARHQALKVGIEAIHLDHLAAHRPDFDRQAAAQLLALDVELNAQGVGVWLDRVQRPH